MKYKLTNVIIYNLLVDDFILGDQPSFLNPKYSKY